MPSPPTWILVFGTRRTLSDTVSQTRGIGAARRWIQSTLEGCAGASGGRMTVSLDGFVAEPSARIPHPVRVANVTATLRPVAGSAHLGERMIIIGAHYDSRAGSPMDSLDDAPGANDDGSGTALVLELARVFSRRSFNATIVFACFAGEEQGLTRSDLRKTASRARWHATSKKQVSAMCLAFPSG